MKKELVQNQVNSHTNYSYRMFKELILFPCFSEPKSSKRRRIIDENELDDQAVDIDSCEPEENFEEPSINPYCEKEILINVS